MKTVLFIPGFQEYLSDRDYASVLKSFESKGYKTRFVSLDWSRTNLTHWLKEFNQVYDDYNPEDTIVAGFSFGAVTAFVAASERNPAELWLCSLSPYFDGDNPKQSGLKIIGIRRAKAFTNVNFPQLAKQIKCSTKILYGALESEGIKHRAATAHRLISNSELIEVANSPHNVATKEYIDVIRVA